MIYAIASDSAVCAFDGKHRTFFGSAGLAQEELARVRVSKDNPSLQVVSFNPSIVLNNMREEEEIVMVVLTNGEPKQALFGRKQVKAWIAKYGD